MTPEQLEALVIAVAEEFVANAVPSGYIMGTSRIRAHLEAFKQEIERKARTEEEVQRSCSWPKAGEGGEAGAVAAAKELDAAATTQSGSPGLPALIAHLKERMATWHERATHNNAEMMHYAARALLAALPERMKLGEKTRKENDDLRVQLQLSFERIVKYENAMADQGSQFAKARQELAQSRPVTEEQIEAAAKKGREAWVEETYFGGDRVWDTINAEERNCWLAIARAILSPTEDRKANE